tara:strand:- start:561 stop:680 length:120 start_codon:yes stop_codon:yes gene_type:complete
MNLLKNIGLLFLFITAVLGFAYVCTAFLLAIIKILFFTQ